MVRINLPTAVTSYEPILLILDLVEDAIFPKINLVWYKARNVERLVRINSINDNLLI